MRTEEVHTLILGGGPSGVAAGYTLAKAGLNPVLLEKDKVCGGLMRSIKRGDFIMDIGRKELYNRLAKVDALWSEVLGKDYRDYPHRGGILYEGQIIDMSPAFQGFRRGMSWSMFAGCAFDFLAARLKRKKSQPRNLEQFFYQQRGKRLTEVFAQGFQEKLTGKKWSDTPLPGQIASSNGAGFISTMRQAIERTFSTKEVNTYKGIWRHPAKGTGQICDALAKGIVERGGRIHFEANVKSISATRGLVDSVIAEIQGETIQFQPEHLVSSIPVEIVLRYLLPDRAQKRQTETRALDPRRRTVVLVYLFLDEEPQFPQAWLQVTSPDTRIGRIANYSAFNGDMVPDGKTCLCCELYCFGGDELLKLTDEQIAQRVLGDCARLKLVHPDKCFDSLVLRLPGADASQNRDNWMSPARLQLLDELKQFRNLYYVNRTETDIATLAGMEAAEAIILGDRADFDRRVDPAQLQIRSEPRAFEFQVPVATEQ
jgi:protoporphyrinogen oxidase